MAPLLRQHACCSPGIATASSPPQHHHSHSHIILVLSICNVRIYRHSIRDDLNVTVLVHNRAVLLLLMLMLLLLELQL